MVKVAEYKDGNYFTKSDHNVEVTIVGGDALESKSGSQYLQFGFEADGKEGDTGYNNYITPKALPYTAARIQSILSHNAKDDKERDALAKELGEVEDDKFADWAIDKLRGKKAYLHISFSDNINPKNGLPYLQKNLAGYEIPAPVEPAVSSVKRELGGEEVTGEGLSNMPF